MPIINPALPSDGTTIDASDVNTPFQAILDVLNGGIDSDNVSPTATFVFKEVQTDTINEQTTGSGVTIDGNKLKDSTVQTTALLDSAGNPQLYLVGNSTPVNQLTLLNAPTGSSPTLSASGSDTNINLNLSAKGTGSITKGGNPIDWWEELGRTTLSVAGGSMSVTFNSRKYLKVLIRATPSTSSALQMGFNSDTASSHYSYRISASGAADTTTTSANFVTLVGSNSLSKYFVMDVLNIATLEKLCLLAGIDGTAGAANVPERFEEAIKWANTTDQISTILVSVSTGNLAIGSELIILGHD